MRTSCCGITAEFTHSKWTFSPCYISATICVRLTRKHCSDREKLLFADEFVGETIVPDEKKKRIKPDFISAERSLCCEITAEFPGSK